MSAEPTDRLSVTGETRYSRIPHWLTPLVSGEAYKLYGVMMQRRDYDTGVATNYLAQFAKDMGKSKSSVKAYIRELKEAGALIVEPQYRGNQQVASHYIVVFNRDTPRQHTAPPRTEYCPTPGQHTAHNSRTNIQEPYIQEESEPHDSDAAIEPEVVDEAEETQTRLLDALDDAVEANGFKRPSRTKANQRAMRLLLTKDGYTEQQVAWMIAWATDHHFWYKNIRSAEKLRQQFDRLVVEAKEQRGHGPTGGTKPNSAEQRGLDHADVIERLRQREAQMTEQGAIGR